jgi:signal transduction histidine kinase
VAKVQTPQHIKALRFTLEGLTRSEADNAEVKQALLKRLDRNVEDTKRLHGQLASRVTVESSRKSLDRDMVVHWMEMDKLAKDVELRKQQQTINSLQRNLQRAMHMLEVQHKVLKGKQHSISHKCQHLSICNISSCR